MLNVLITDRFRYMCHLLPLLTVAFTGPAMVLNKENMPTSPPRCAGFSSKYSLFLMPSSKLPPSLIMQKYVKNSTKKQLWFLFFDQIYIIMAVKNFDVIVSFKIGGLNSS